MKKTTLTSLFFLVFSLGVFAQQRISDFGEDDSQVIFDQNLSEIQDVCEQMQSSNAFENGLFMEAGGQLVANDFIVDPLIDFTVTTLTANIFSQGGIASIDVIFYDDSAGLPGTELVSFLGIVPESQVIVGSNFGFDIHETVLTIPDAVFSAGADSTTFWVQLIGNPAAGGSELAWEVTTLNAIGNETVFDDGSGVFQYDGGNDGVFTISGDCTLSIPQFEDPSFSYFPNPTNSIVSFNGQNIIEHISVINMIGQEVIRTTPNATSNDLDMSLLHSGTYFVRVTINDTSETVKVIKK